MDHLLKLATSIAGKPVKVTGAPPAQTTGNGLVKAHTKTTPNPVGSATPGADIVNKGAIAAPTAPTKTSELVAPHPMPATPFSQKVGPLSDGLRLAGAALPLAGALGYGAYQMMRTRPQPPVPQPMSRLPQNTEGDPAQVPAPRAEDLPGAKMASWLPLSKQAGLVKRVKDNTLDLADQAGNQLLDHIQDNQRTQYTRDHLQRSPAGPQAI